MDGTSMTTLKVTSDMSQIEALRKRNRELLIETRRLMTKLDHSKKSAADGGYAEGRYSDLYNEDGRFEAPFMPAGLRNYRQGKADHDEDAEMRFNLLADFRVTRPLEIHECVNPNEFFVFSSGEGTLMSGQKYTNEYVHFAVFRNGRLDLLREYFDSAKTSRIATDIAKNPAFRE
jgi:ketosteroid isomerase-like protein